MTKWIADFVFRFVDLSRPTDPRLAGLQAEGKELLRKKLIGKPVRSSYSPFSPL